LRPLQVGALGSGVALVIVLARLLVAADGDVSRFVVAGDMFVDAGTVDPDIHVFEGSGGYDGQFFWRLAVDPQEWDDEPAHGVRLDSAYRPPRIGYPLLAWLGAGGHPGLVAWSLVGVNVVAFGLIAGFGAVLADRAGRLPVWGLLVAGAPGLVLALSRDLAEVVTLAALLGGVVALSTGVSGLGSGDRPGAGLDRHRTGSAGPVLATLAWSFAVVSREQALVVIAGYGLWRLAGVVTRRVRAGVDDLPWVVPPLVFVAWQGVLWASLGELPAAAASGSNLALPFADLVPAMGRWAQGDIARLEILTPVQLVLAGVLVVTAFRFGRARLAPDDGWLPVSLGLTALAAVCLARPVWDGPADLRQASDVFALSWIVLLLGSGQQPPRWLVGATGTVWLATVALRVAAI
jgi:hypothetical protein